MERYTFQERLEIIEIHYKNGENLAETVRKTRTFFGRRVAPCRTTIKKLVEKFKLLGQVSDVKNKTRARRSRTAEKIAAVAESLEENPGLSIPRRSLKLGIPQTSLHRILHKDLGLMSNEASKKVQPISVVKPTAGVKRKAESSSDDSSDEDKAPAKKAAPEKPTDYGDSENPLEATTGVVVVEEEVVSGNPLEIIREDSVNHKTKK